MKQQSIFVSVVAPVCHAEGYVESFVLDCLAVLRAHYRDLELIIIDDASTDGTMAVCSRLCQGNPELRVVRLARRYGRDVAFVAGLDTAIGDYIVLLRPGIDPPAEIPAMVQLATEGAGVVTAVDRGRRSDGPLSRMLRRLFHGYTNRALGLNYIHRGTVFQVLSRAAAVAAARVRSKQPSFPLLSSQIGYGGASHPYVPLKPPAGAGDDGLFSKIDRGITILVHSSIAPLRLVSYLGVFVGLLNLAYAGYVVVINLVKDQVAEGWTTLSLQLSGMFFFLFVVLVVLCEYVGRTLTESIDRPLYTVAEERTGSPVLPMADRHNVEERSA